MKKVEFYEYSSYNKENKMEKNNKKTALIITSSTIMTSMLICIGAFYAIHANSQKLTGQGGADTSAIPSSVRPQNIAEDLEGPDLSELESDVGEEIVQTENTTGKEEAPAAVFDEELTYFSYRIKKGDMIGVIAEKYDITQDTLLSVNNIRSSRTIQIGQYIKIPSMSGILYTVKSTGETPETIAKKYSVDVQKIAVVNELQQNTSLKAGASLFVPDAKLDWVTRQEINGDLFRKPIHGSFRYSSYYGWRQNPFDASRRTYHSGVDMACPMGTNIYAALEGTVTTAGWSDVYGNYVIITHHSGYKTLYGHMSKIVAKKGQYVTQNTIIGKVGSTGQSTGPHCHFQVYKNGQTVNPLNLW